MQDICLNLKYEMGQCCICLAKIYIFINFICHTFLVESTMVKCFTSVGPLHKTLHMPCMFFCPSLLNIVLRMRAFDRCLICKVVSIIDSENIHALHFLDYLEKTAIANSWLIIQALFMLAFALINRRLRIIINL